VPELDGFTPGEHRWIFEEFKNLSGDQVYALVQLRQKVFVVEQRCAFLDADGFDRVAWHLFAHCGNGEVAVCLRILPPGTTFRDPSIGRLVTAPDARRQGWGRAAMIEAIHRTQEMFPGQPIRLAGQSYLTGFYEGLGFQREGEPFLEDGIPHVNLVLSGEKPYRDAGN
jgi:ElaA protein